MPRHLVVANLTLGGQALREVLEQRVAAGSARFHLLVPATPPVTGWGAHDEDTDTAAARERLEKAMARVEELGAEEVTGETRPARPVDVIGDVLREQADDPFDEIILSTLPAGPSRWLAMDLPRRVARAHAIPLTHVEGPPE
ncbi:hypothetical protein [Euzebya sp.]|uniref:hypothetical protein n=1 Tax=Euzebya sp. TaxID=1971409 RepID=UPI003515FD67